MVLVRERGEFWFTTPIGASPTCRPEIAVQDLPAWTAKMSLRTPAVEVLGREGIVRALGFSRTGMCGSIPRS
jgi:hypothetical protein